MALVLAMLLPLASGCRGVQYQANGLASWPNHAGANDWQYTLILNVSTRDSGSMADPQLKDVEVRVDDRKGSRLLDDVFQRANTCLIEGEATWVTFDTINVTLWEKGSADSSSPVSVALARAGRRVLYRLTYRYDAVAKLFKRV